MEKKLPEPGRPRSDIVVHCFRLLLLVFFYLFNCNPVQARVAADDAAEADRLARVYKDDNVICRSSHRVFTFDKGLNSLNDKVVTVQEDAVLEFLSLKKYFSLTYPEFYNKFIRLKG